FFVGSALTDRAGKARLDALPRGVTWVLVSASGRARQSARLTLAAGMTHFRATLVPESILDVRVTDERGAAIAKATVLVPGGDPLPCGARTQSDGRARVSRLPAPPCRVRASAPGYETVERADVTREVTLALRRLASIQVRVEHADGSAAP